MDDDLKKYLYINALQFELKLSEDQLDLCNEFINELLEWNDKINLTGVHTPKKIINELLLDSLIPVRFIDAGGKMLDIGSGAGWRGGRVAEESLFRHPRTRRGDRGYHAGAGACGDRGGSARDRGSRRSVECGRSGGGRTDVPDPAKMIRT